MSKDSELLARQLVQLDVAIKRAAKQHNYWQAAELEQAREHILELRSAVLRKEWREVRKEVQVSR